MDKAKNLELGDNMVSDLILEDNGVTISGDKDQLIKIQGKIIGYDLNEDFITFDSKINANRGINVAQIENKEGSIDLLAKKDKFINIQGKIRGHDQDEDITFDSKVNANFGMKVDRIDVNELVSSKNGFVNINGYIITDYGLKTNDILSKNLDTDITIKSGSGEIYLLSNHTKHIWVRGHIKGYNQDPGGYDPEGDFVNFGSKINAKYGIEADKIESSGSINLRVNKDQFKKTIKLSVIEFQEQEKDTLKQKGIKIELADANRIGKAAPINPDRQCNFILTGDKILIEIIETIKPPHFIQPVKQTSYMDLVSVIRNLQKKLNE